MRLTVIRDDNLIGVNGEFYPVDLSGLDPDLHAIQWRDSEGHIEYRGNRANEPITDPSILEPFIAMWNAAAPSIKPGPQPEQLREAAQARINAAYEQAVMKLIAGYPNREIESWAKQEIEARAWLKDRNTVTPWIDSAAMARGIPKPEFVAKVIEQADALAPMHGALSGKRQYLRDQIDALTNPTQEQLDAIQW